METASRNLYFSRKVLAGFIAILFAALIVGCSGGGSGDDSAGGDAATDNELQAALAKPLGDEIDCPSLVITPSSAVPGETVVLTGIPGEMGEAGIRVIEQTADGEKIDPLFLHADATAGEARFTTPLLPSRDPEGGAVELEFGDGDNRCRQLPFTIEPLPDAPEGYALTVQQELESWVDESLAVLGYDPADLLNADPDDLPPARLGLWLAKQFVSAADNPDALPALAEEAANDGDNLLERLLKASDLQGNIDAARLALETVPTGVYQPAAAGTGAVGLYQQQASRKIAAVSGTGGDPQSIPAKQAFPTCSEQAFDPDKLTISSALELSNRILAARQGYVFDGSTSGRALGGAAVADVKNTGSAAGYAGTAVFAISTVEAARRALEPQRITSFEVGRVDTLWVEDRPPANTLFWAAATVKAKGTSFNLGKATLQSLVTALGMVPGPVGAATTVATTGAPDAVNKAMDELTKDSCFRIRAPEYGPINVSDEAWTRSEIEGGTVERVDHRQYRGIDIGASTLVVALRGVEFGLIADMTKRFTVEVEPIRMSLVPSFTHVTEPGEQVKLSATAANAYTDPANFTAEAAKGQIAGQYQNGEFYDVDYVTPASRDDYPADVEFTWLGRTLPDGTVRSRPATVDTQGRTTIDPQAACLLPNQEVDLSAELEGFIEENRSVTWNASFGQIVDAVGLTATFIAPASAAVVEITVSADADPEVTDTVEYTIDNACIKKVWYPVAGLTADGNGTYLGPDPSSICSVVDTRKDVQEETIEVDPEIIREPPEVPSDYELWFTRTETIGSDFLHESSRHVVDDRGTADPSDDICSSVSLRASNVGLISYYAEGDGTLGLSMSADLVNNCSEHTTGGVDCAGVGALAGTNGLYYVTVPSEATYNVAGELQCADLAGTVSILPITGTLVRYVDGAVPYQPAEGVTGVRNLNGIYRSPQLFSLTCTQPNQSVPFDVDFILDAPEGAGADLVVLQITGGLFADPASTAKNGFGPPGTGISLDPDKWNEPEPGTYKTRADFGFSVKLTPR